MASNYSIANIGTGGAPEGLATSYSLIAETVFNPIKTSYAHNTDHTEKYNKLALVKNPATAFKLPDAKKFYNTTGNLNKNTYRIGGMNMTDVPLFDKQSSSYNPILFQYNK